MICHILYYNNSVSMIQINIINLLAFIRPTFKCNNSALLLQHFKHYIYALFKTNQNGFGHYRYDRLIFGT